MVKAEKPNICGVCGYEPAPFKIVIEEPGKEDDHRMVCRECLVFLTSLQRRERA